MLEIARMLQRPSPGHGVVNSRPRKHIPYDMVGLDPSYPHPNVIVPPCDADVVGGKLLKNAW